MVEVVAALPKWTEKQPSEFGWPRSTWTQELLALQAGHELEIGVSRSHMGRLLKKASCRRVKPKLTIVCWHLPTKSSAWRSSTRSFGLGGDDAVPAVAEAEPELASLVAESIAFPKDRLVDPGLAHTASEPSARRQYGGNLHVGRPSARTTARERLCQYLLPPPTSHDRLTPLPDGRVSLALKTPWRDGTILIVLTAIQPIARLAALVPRPGQNLVRYHGVLAANAKDRAAIVPVGPPAAPSGTHDADVTGPPHLPPPLCKNGRYLEWAALMLGVFEIQVLPKSPRETDNRSALNKDPTNHGEGAATSLVGLRPARNPSA